MPHQISQTAWPHDRLRLISLHTVLAGSSGYLHSSFDHRLRLCCVCDAISYTLFFLILCNISYTFSSFSFFFFSLAISLWRHALSTSMKGGGGGGTLYWHWELEGNHVLLLLLLEHSWVRRGIPWDVDDWVLFFIGLGRDTMGRR
ncbi:hypothetical protein M431DRAFT_438558 [Trichoderma harzianum CBS 226.95]|uniref:Uncharacterized protein n=1 Tax=Trichoderma harzianum CBS 226.95 TaxID=983964 RepID=A0A2T4AE28_TRIHA|nr:hypothetical protein M431DRAFT_438558 [Trichoderma harzianum CBS 226.95]PTB55178.1 hypothetical protein M431DRAFT_438558 [Trichoderma harzianum CBS 226.95]